MSELKTRDGKVIKELGSWEKSQINKIEDRIAKPKPKQPANGRGRKPFDIEKFPLLYIHRIHGDDEVKGYWSVKPVIDGLKQPTKAFYDKKYGGKEKSFKEALKYRDSFIKEQLKK